MSTLKVNALNNGGSAIDFPSSFKLGGNPIEQGYTPSATEPSSPNTGDLWWDSANETLYQYLNGEFKALSVVDSSISWGGTKYVVQTSNTQLDTFSTTTLGNSSNFITLYSNSISRSAASDTSRGLYLGGGATTGIDYFTFSTATNASDFGDFPVRVEDAAAASDGTYAISAGGYQVNASNRSSTEVVTIQTTGNSTSGFSLTVKRRSPAAGTDGTNMLIFNGQDSTSYASVDYASFTSTATASDFGDMTIAGWGRKATSDASRTVVGGGYSGGYSNVIDYVTTSTPGNGTDFGDLVSTYMVAPCAGDGTYAIWAGGFNGSTYTNVIQYVTIQTTGNAADFGDLTGTANYPAATSGAAS